MYDFFGAIINKIFKKTNSWPINFLITIIIVGLLILMDVFVFRITYHYHINNKLNQIEKIKNIKANYILDSIDSIQINQIEYQVYKNKHYSEVFFSKRVIRDRTKFINKARIDTIIVENDEIALIIVSQNLMDNDSIISKKISNDTSKKIIPAIPSINSSSIKSKLSIRSKLWMIISSNYIFLILLFALLIMPITTPENLKENNGIITWLTVIILISIVILSVTWFAYKIPIIYNRPYLNYILNALIHLLLISPIFYKFSKS